MLLTAIYLLLGAGELSTAAAGMPASCMLSERDVAVFEYLKKEMKDSDIIIFAKPRALTLFTGKKCMNAAWEVSYQKNKEIFDSVKAKYLLVRRGLDGCYYAGYLRQVGRPVDSIRLAGCYTLYSLR